MRGQRWEVEPQARDFYRSLGASCPDLYELSSDRAAAAFHKSISQAKQSNHYGAAVFVYPEADYAGMRLFLTQNGKTGFAIKQGGDIVSVFNALDS